MDENTMMNENTMQGFIPSCPDVLTMEEFQAVLRISSHKAYSMVRSGEIPAFFVGRRYRLLKRDIEEYIAVSLASYAEKH